MRQTGYYWVKYKGDWVVAEYGEFYDWLSNLSCGWHLPGKCEGYCGNEYVCAPIYVDDSFSEINETRILNPDEISELQNNAINKAYGFDYSKSPNPDEVPPSFGNSFILQPKGSFISLDEEIPESEFYNGKKNI